MRPYETSSVRRVVPPKGCTTSPAAACEAARGSDFRSQGAGAQARRRAGAQARRHTGDGVWLCGPYCCSRMCRRDPRSLGQACKPLQRTSPRAHMDTSVPRCRRGVASSCGGACGFALVSLPHTLEAKLVSGLVADSPRQSTKSGVRAGPAHPESQHERQARAPSRCRTANLRTKILDFIGFDSSIILILMGGILMSIGNLPEALIQQILVGRILVGRLGVPVRPAGGGLAPRKEAPRAGGRRGWWNTVGSLVEMLWLNKNLSKASI